MAPKHQQTLLSMFAAAVHETTDNKNTQVKKEHSQPTEVSGDSIPSSRRTPDASHSQQNANIIGEPNNSSIQKSLENGPVISNPELSPRRKRRRADSIFSDKMKVSGNQSHRAAKTQKINQSPQLKSTSPTATAQAEAHPYHPHNTDVMKGSMEDGCPYHTPTTFIVASQTSIDTPPVGVSRLPSQNVGNTDSHILNGDPDHQLNAKLKNMLDDDEHVNDIDKVDNGLSTNEKMGLPSSLGRSIDSEVDTTTPIPIPRSSMPPNFRFTGSSSVRTPRPVRNLDFQESKKESSVNDHHSCFIPLTSDDLSGETQERPKKTLFDDDPMDCDNTRTEALKGSSKKRHSMDLGSLRSDNYGGTKQAGVKRNVPNSTKKTLKNKMAQQEKTWETGRGAMDDSKQDKSHEEVKTNQQGSLAAMDPIENVSQTDDEIERVDVGTSRGAQLLQAAMTKQHQSSSSTVSLFASVNVTSNSPRSNDLSSPRFDPTAFATDTMLLTPPKKDSQSFKFALIALTFDQIEALKSSGVGSRKKTIVLLTNLYRLLIWYSPKDLIPTLYICLNKVAPDYDGLEVGIGESHLIRIIVDVYGRSESSIKNDLKKYEDLGKVAELCRCSMLQLFKPPVLTIQSVFSVLKALTTISGKNSQEQKRASIKKLLAAAEKSESKCIIRFLQGKMRVGVQSATVYQALAFAFALTSPQSLPDSIRISTSDVRRSSKKRLSSSEIDQLLTSFEIAVKTALSEVSNIEVVTNFLFEGYDASTLGTKCVVTPGIPLQPMLAKPTKGFQDVLTRFADCQFTCEFKYDGERAQIHLLPNKTVAVFSRNLENLTSKYPDVINAAKGAFKPNVTECILDSEVVAYDTKTQKIQSFQLLSTRKRKGVEVEDVAVQVCIFAFDCIQFNGQSLTKQTFEERRKYLKKCIDEIPNKFMFARHSEMNTLEEVDSFFQEAVDSNCEGLMVKTLNANSSYEPSKRSLNWLKIKKDYLDHMSDSVDLIPIGAYRGRGRRAKCYGTYLLACYNPDEEVYQTVCKVGTGFSDEDLAGFYEFFQTKVTSVKDPSYEVDDKLEADVWFEPCVVWEVRAADLSLSPVHTGGIGLGHQTKGIGLRFPRFVRARNDKKPGQATTNIQIFEMYNSQFAEGKSCTKLPVTVDEEDTEDD